MRLFILVAVAILVASYVYPESFDDYKRTQTKSYEEHFDFESMKKSLNKDFEAYKRIYDDEFAKFSGIVKKNWGDPLITTDKTWVEYSGDMRVRKIMNFETGRMTIQIKDTSSKADKAAFIKEVSAFITEDVKTAFKNDILANNVEKRMKSSGIKAEYSSLSGGAVLFGLVSDIKNPNVSDISKAASDIVSKGTIKTEILSNGDKVLTFTSDLDVGNAPEKGTKPALSANMEIGKIHKKAGDFKDYVKKYAAARKMPEALVYAIIHNESSFNPMATSHIPAYGMMQLVPSSGGAEAAAVYFGKPIILGPSYLYNPDNNIKLGTTYLSQLYYNYFKGIENPETRLYCTISAYNTGPGNVARAFIGSRKLNDAIPVINGMTPQQAYKTLISSLPYDETKTYLKRVSGSYNAYYGF